MSSEQIANLYHSPQEAGYWTDKGAFNRNINLKNGKILEEVVPIGVKRLKNTLVMELSSFEGDIYEPIDNFLGLKVVDGDSRLHPYEKDGELLIQFIYYKIDGKEDKPRRIRPSAIMFGIHGDTEKASMEKGGHRAMGESADYYLEGTDTRYDPKADKSNSLRRFPFWRSGVWGDSVELAKKYLPEPQIK